MKPFEIAKSILSIAMIVGCCLVMTQGAFGQDTEVMRLTAKLRGKTVTGDAVYDQKGKVYQLLITAQDAKPGSTLKITVTRGAAFQKIGTMKIDELGRGKFSVRNSQGIMPSLLENDQVQLWHGNDSLASGRMTVRK